MPYSDYGNPLISILLDENTTTIGETLTFAYCICEYLYTMTHSLHLLA
jgi:hypothetical protein